MASRFDPAATGSHTGREGPDGLPRCRAPKGNRRPGAYARQTGLNPFLWSRPPSPAFPFEAGVVAFGSPATGQADPLLVFSLDDQGDRGEVETFGRILSGLRMLQSRQRGVAAEAIPELRAPLVIERAIRREPPIRD